MNYLSSMAIPLILAICGVGMLISKKDLAASFISGAEEGLKSAVRLLPTLVLLMTAVGMLNASGAADYLARLLAPIMDKIGVPSELTSVLLVRPVSGSASTALLSELYSKYGPDSFVGRCASVILGSSDTMIYVIAVYMSAAKIKNTKNTVAAAFAVMLLCIFLSCAVARIFFGA